MLILYLFNTFAIQGRMPKSGFMANMKSVSDVVLPLFGNMGFLPMVYLLLEVFMCTKTYGDDAGDTFLRKDCYVDCWIGVHNLYALFAAICLTFYLPVSIYMRPKW
jgi:hypothetical protein